MLDQLSSPVFGIVESLASPVEEINPALSIGDGHFRCLGVSGTTFYFQPGNVAEIIELSASQLKKPHILRLAPLQWWESQWPAKGGCNWDEAVNALVQSCMARGAYNANRLTGRGTYVEPGTLAVVTHLGSHLLVNDEPCSVTAQKSARIFIEGTPTELPDLPPLANGEARRIEALCSKLDWASPEMAKLFAGFLVIAPVCGALPWRPHVWINGPFESGKSFALKNVLGRLLAGISFSFGGSITEAGIRQDLGHDALPVLIDEAEAKDERAAQRLDAVLELARSSSQPGGAAIVKGGAAGKATHYRVQSAFAFASIDVPIRQSADESRIVRLTLRGPDEATDAVERGKAFGAIKAELADLVRANYGPRLFYRTRKLLLTILQNSDAFGAAIAARTGSGRLGDVLGPLVAGWFSLVSDKRVLPADAARKIDEWKWLSTAITKNKTQRDYEAALAHLMQSFIGLDHGYRRTVAELVAMASAAEASESPEAASADAALRRNGIRVRKEGRSTHLLICRGSGAVKALFHGTQWSASPVETISQNPRATITDNPIRFGGGIKQRAISIDLNLEGYGDE
ncbi:hypothetical protein J5277_16435 [Rhizobium sp. 16-449-1b]|uniref:hypothetical protein n=1 Tax=Rhizobium sp. 16-449-1b TaxID=2819989 RepID=UPI001ADBBF19|nr:hypothetical protein [Rhizobium sp. 16-449-1b]MBO9195695.1 hypothetical protein [Rhizobium sp. 16-449-1b]